ncbi:DUF4224 domain-containing protein [Microvirgula aerodenitrificans]|uniref:DUF4224 domain-containing protein n=1 Tax=Microvirgula aerodenitrificans TaxID=57480 RepID=UPI00248DA285|nr:DUF4224 domain-containing protein [Microvirgula aerodenitrificans]
MTTDEIVPFDELATVSGYKRPRCIRDWLDANRIRYLQNASGRPIVARSTFMQALGVKPIPIDPTPLRGINTANLDHLHAQKRK